MYRCEICRKIVPAHTPLNRVIIATRSVTYPQRINANQFKSNHKRERRDDRGGTGTQIAIEVRACAACARR
jgi:hypothetical protein